MFSINHLIIGVPNFDPCPIWRSLFQRHPKAPNQFAMESALAIGSAAATTLSPLRQVRDRPYQWGVLAGLNSIFSGNKSSTPNLPGSILIYQRVIGTECELHNGMFLWGISWDLPAGVIKHRKLGNPRSRGMEVLLARTIHPGIFQHAMFSFKYGRIFTVDGCNSGFIKVLWYSYSSSEKK